MRFVIVAPFLLVLSSGCASTPSFDQVSGVTPKTIIDTIECELITARNSIEARRRRNRTKHSLCDYVVVADLSLQVDEQMVLAPSFTHTDIVSKSLTRVFDWGVKLDTQAQRTYSQSVNFEIAELALDKERRCDAARGTVSLNGSLGLEEVIEMGFSAIDPEDVGIRTVDDVPTVGCDANLDVRPPVEYLEQFAMKRKPAGGSDREKKKSVFSTQIEFVLLRNINSTGPTWTLQQFRGPGKLFSAQRTDTHGLTIGFARAERRGGALVGVNSAIDAAIEQNEKAKTDSLRNNLRLLQQRLP